MAASAFLRWIPLVVLVVAGCSSDPNRPYPVRGTIVYEDGQPAKDLAGGTVNFALISEKGGGSSIGPIAADATFILTHQREGDGAVAGKHRVVISPPEPDDEGGDKRKARRTLPKVAIDPASAVQEVTVEPRSNNLTLKVKKLTSK